MNSLKKRVKEGRELFPLLLYEKLELKVDLYGIVGQLGRSWNRRKKAECFFWFEIGKVIVGCKYDEVVTLLGQLNARFGANG